MIALKKKEFYLPLELIDLVDTNWTQSLSKRKSAWATAIGMKLAHPYGKKYSILMQPSPTPTSAIEFPIY